MSDMLEKDGLSALLKRATDILFVMNPRATSMGSLFGIVVDAMVKIFDPALKNQNIVDFTKVNTFYYILIGIFIFNLPAALRRHNLDPQIESALFAIKKAKREHEISAAQARMMYLSLYEKILSQVVLDKDTRNKVRQIKNLSDNADTIPKGLNQ